MRKSENCRNVVRDIDIVFNIAAHVGGIGLNRDKPGELFYDNLMMGTQLLHEAKNASVENFVALGTVCDVVNLKNYNRNFVIKGLEIIKQRKNKAIAKIIDNSKIYHTPTSTDLGFIIGPQLNAASRVDDSS